MTGRLADVQTRIETVETLASVVSAMRGLAATRSQEARRQTESIRVYAATIGSAIGQALALAGDPAADAASSGEVARNLVVVLGAEQGFAGAFSEGVLDKAEPFLRDPHRLLMIGSRGRGIAEERGWAVDWSASMISDPSRASSLAARTTEAIYERLARSPARQVFVVHAAPVRAMTAQIVSKRLVPFDYSRFSVPVLDVPPRTTLPPAILLARLVEEYIFAELSEAVVLSFAAENEARMKAMVAAHDNVRSSLAELVATSRLLRQEEITEEIVELASGSLSAR